MKLSLQTASMVRTLLLCAALSSVASVSAEDGEMTGEEYRKMLQQALKSGSYSQNQVQSWDARLKVLSGEVMVKVQGSDVWSKISGEIPLNSLDVVKTSGDGVAEIYLDSKGAMALGRNTELEITALEQENTAFSINFGSLVAKIAHFLNEKHKLQVRTPTAVCAIRGTEFAAEYSSLGKEASFAVFDEGRVSVTQSAEAGKEPQEYILEKNTEIGFNPSQKRFRSVPLSRMGKFRGALGTVRARLPSLKEWKPRSPAEREELRSAALKRKIVHRQLKDAASKAKAKRALKGKKAAVKKGKAKLKRGVRVQGEEQP